MTKRSVEEEGTAFFPAGSDVLAKSRWRDMSSRVISPSLPCPFVPSFYVGY
jgi:hypothetical protein